MQQILVFLLFRFLSHCFVNCLYPCNIATTQFSYSLSCFQFIFRYLSIYCIYSHFVHWTLLCFKCTMLHHNQLGVFRSSMSMDPFVMRIQRMFGVLQGIPMAILSDIQEWKKLFRMFGAISCRRPNQWRSWLPYCNKFSKNWYIKKHPSILVERSIESIKNSKQL